jgi:hypothetical protein
VEALRRRERGGGVGAAARGRRREAEARRERGGGAGQWHEAEVRRGAAWRGVSDDNARRRRGASEMAARGRWREARHQRRRCGGDITAWYERQRRGVSDSGVSDGGTRCKIDLQLESVRDLFTIQDAKMGICHEFCYGVSNQYESFICLDLMVKNREVPIERYFKWWTNTKLV